MHVYYNRTSWYLTDCTPVGFLILRDSTCICHIFCSVRFYWRLFSNCTYVSTLNRLLESPANLILITINKCSVFPFVSTIQSNFTCPCLLIFRGVGEMRKANYVSLASDTMSLPKPSNANVDSKTMQVVRNEQSDWPKRSYPYLSYCICMT